MMTSTLPDTWPSEGHVVLKIPGHLVQLFHVEKTTCLRLTIIAHASSNHFVHHNDMVPNCKHRLLWHPVSMKMYSEMQVSARFDGPFTDQWCRQP